MHFFILIFLFILPAFYKASFWLYTFQLKNYRWDRFKEYLGTPQGKKALLNFWFFIEFPVLILTMTLLIEPLFEVIVFNIIFYLLVLENIFVLGKIFRKKFIKPKLTGRLLLLMLVLFLGMTLDIGFILIYTPNLFYTYIMFFLLLPYIFILIINLIILPLVDFKKKSKIKKAIKKSQKIIHPVRVGITGSYGKSSVKEFLSHILKEENKVLKTPENINTEMGISEIILKKLKNKFDYFIAEMGAYRIGEIKLLGEIVNHKHGFLTAIGNQHIGLFGSQENIITGKNEIIESIQKNKGILYVNFDDINIKTLKFPENLTVIKYGTKSYCDAYYMDIKIKDGNTYFTFHYKKKQYTFQTLLIGKHNILNLTGVIAFCLDQKISIKTIKKVLKKIKPPKNTLKIKKIRKNLTIIDDTYNLSEAGLFAGLEALQSFSGKKILALDDILELGKEAEKIHFQIGKKIAEDTVIDEIIYVGINYFSSIEKGLLKGGFEKENIKIHLGKIPNKEKVVILGEGRRTKKYMENI